MGKEIVKHDEEATLNWPSSSSSTTSSLYENKGTIKMPLLALNHVSFVCKSVPASVQFYEQVLGFDLIQRPSSFNFDGAWLFNHGIGIHLLGKEDVERKKGKIINPKENHISFQCSDMDLIIRRLNDLNIEYVTATVKEDEIIVDQLFFHDPDGNMIEICNCQNIPILPLSSNCPLKKISNIPTFNHTMPFEENGDKKRKCLGEMEYQMMNLAANLIDISF